MKAKPSQADLIRIAAREPYCRSGARLVIWDKLAGFRIGEDFHWRPGKLHTPKQNGRKFKRKDQKEMEI